MRPIEFLLFSKLFFGTQNKGFKHKNTRLKMKDGTSEKKKEEKKKEEKKNSLWNMTPASTQMQLTRNYVLWFMFYCFIVLCFICLCFMVFRTPVTAASVTRTATMMMMMMTTTTRCLKQFHEPKKMICFVETVLALKKTGSCQPEGRGQGASEPQGQPGPEGGGSEEADPGQFRKVQLPQSKTKHTNLKRR